MTVETVQKLTAEEFGLPVSAMIGPRKLQEIVEARQASMYLCCLYTKAVLRRIAVAHKRRDHGTTIWAFNRVKDIRAIDSGYSKKLDRIEIRIQAMSAMEAA